MYIEKHSAQPSLAKVAINYKSTISSVVRKLELNGTHTLDVGIPTSSYQKPTTSIYNVILSSSSVELTLPCKLLHKIKIGIDLI